MAKRSFIQFSPPNHSMAYNFTADFINYAGESECPPNYIRWASLFPLACAAGRRFYTCQGRLLVKPELCLVFVGPSSNKKSHAKDLAKSVVTEALPEITIAADITSKDDLTRLICSKDSLRWFVNHEGAEVEYHPVSLFVDEIRHFMSYSPSAMIAFLVDIYDKKYYKSSTLKRGLEEASEPCVNILGCTTQDWIVEQLKSKILSGGWSRRFITIFEPGRSKTPNYWPVAPPNEREIFTRMRDHLRKIEHMAGVFIWTVEAQAWLKNWYDKNFFNFPDDPHLQAYYANKDKNVIKVAMLLALAAENPQLLITDTLLATAMAFFEPIEENLPSLYLSGGRNELVVAQQKILELLYQGGGGLSKRDLMIKMQKDLSPMEQLSTFRFLQESGQISLALPVLMPDGRTQDMIMLPSKHNEVKKNNGKWIINGEGKL